MLRSRKAVLSAFTPNPMDISVYLQSQDHTRDCPAHHCTRTLMRLVLAAELADPVGQNAIRLTVDLLWKDVKTLARLAIQARHIELLPELPIREYPLNEICLDADFQRTMRYPVLLAKDQRSSWAEAV
jgi:hypothetical protein